MVKSKAKYEDFGPTRIAQLLQPIRPEQLCRFQEMPMHCIMSAGLKPADFFNAPQYELGGLVHILVLAVTGRHKAGAI